MNSATFTSVRLVVRSLAAVALLFAAVAAIAQEAPPAATPLEKDAAEQAERVAALEKSLSGAVLVGHFTITGRDGEPREERYELGEVKHLQGDMWLISARIKYGENDVTIPLTLPIRWAGDTPVITVDEMAFPGLGSYTARVMIYRDAYAGFWSGKDHGGHLFGVLERPTADDDANEGAESTPAAAPPDDEGDDKD
jgi:hypothetical protein